MRLPYLGTLSNTPLRGVLKTLNRRSTYYSLNTTCQNPPKLNAVESIVLPVEIVLPRILAKLDDFLVDLRSTVTHHHKE